MLLLFLPEYGFLSDARLPADRSVIDNMHRRLVSLTPSSFVTYAILLLIISGSNIDGRYWRTVDTGYIDGSDVIMTRSLVIDALMTVGHKWSSNETEIGRRSLLAAAAGDVDDDAVSNSYYDDEPETIVFNRLTGSESFYSEEHFLRRRHSNDDPISESFTHPDNSNTSGIEGGATDASIEFLDFIENVNRADCSTSSSKIVQYEAATLPASVFSRFSQQTSSAIYMANVLNNLYRSSVNAPIESEAVNTSGSDTSLYFSFVRALVESQDSIYGAAIQVFHRSPQALHESSASERSTSAFAFRNSTNGRISIRNSELMGDTLDLDRWFEKEKEMSQNQVRNEDWCGGKSNEGDKTMDDPSLTNSMDSGQWSRPFFDCTTSKSWFIAYSSPFYGCNQSNQLILKGIVKIYIDLDKIDINQCSQQNDIFSNSHKCHESTQCVPTTKHGFRRGGYRCVCAPGFYYPPTSATSPIIYFEGLDIERRYRLLQQRQGQDLSDIGFQLYESDFKCHPCPAGCTSCDVNNTCFAAGEDHVIRVVFLCLQIFSMFLGVVAAVAIIKLRKSKVMKSSFWLLLEIIVIGTLLMDTTVVIQYFKATNITCVLIPWFREVGFVVVYGSLMLKVYRVLAEFQSRKAQRILLRDKDLLRYLAGILTIVFCYMVTWTVIHIGHIADGGSLLESRITADGFKYSYCSSRLWDYVMEIEEFLFLSAAIFLCYCIRSAPSFYLETRFISAAIYNETFTSVVFHIVRHCLWTSIHPNYLYLLFFLRCQLTVTVTLILVVGTKVWYTHRPPSDATCRRRAYSSADTCTQDSQPNTETIKLNIPSAGSSDGAAVAGVGDEGDIADINLADMNPEDIRAELKRLYTQLQIYKTKSMRKDNPHISKRRGGRKQTHRRFSLQAFHYKHKLQLHHGVSASTGESGDHDTNEPSRTPEDSINSADGGPGPSPTAVTSGAGDELTPETRTRTVSLSKPSSHR